MKWGKYVSDSFKYWKLWEITETGNQKQAGSNINGFKFSERLLLFSTFHIKIFHFIKKKS
jgi:hypothetical protein